MQYDLSAPDGPKTYTFPPEEEAAAEAQTSTLTSATEAAVTTELPVSWYGLPGRDVAPRYHRTIIERRRRQQRLRWRGGSGGGSGGGLSASSQLDAAVSRRLYIYRHGLYSRYVGNNAFSGYREITPEVVNREPRLVSRAQRWIRRELQAFTFPYGSGFREDLAADRPPSASSSTNAAGGAGGGGGLGSSTSTSSPPSSQTLPLSSPYINNPEFLLDYIIAILRTVDIRAAAGHAETLLCGFFGGGRETTRLFLHELYAFLRSPFADPRQWDQVVQYGVRVPDAPRNEGALLRRRGRSRRL